MADTLVWTDVNEIGFRLSEKHAAVDPYSVRFTELHKYVMELDGFVGESKKSNEKILEAIQAAWADELED